MASVIVENSLELDTLIQRMKDMDKVYKNAVKKGSAPIAKEARRRAPKGDPEHQPEHKALRKTITTKVSQEGTVITASTGPTAAHARLVEFGHESPSGSWVAAKQWWAPAIDTQMPESERITEQEISDGLAKLSK